jgi:hypothetical protein
VIVDVSEELSQPVATPDHNDEGSHSHGHSHGAAAISREEMIRNFKLGQKKNLWLKIGGCVKPVENPFAIGSMTTSVVLFVAYSLLLFSLLSFNFGSFCFVLTTRVDSVQRGEVRENKSGELSQRR